MRHKFSALVSPALACAAALFVLSACGSPEPIPTTFPLTFQQKIQSAAHWQMVAADMWTEIEARMQAAGYNENVMGLEPPADKTQFTRAMDDFLYTEIINHGIGVAPGAPFTLTYNVQVVHYASGRDGPATPGLFTTAAGVGLVAWQGWRRDWGVGAVAPIAVPLAAGADFVDGWTASDSDTEIILTFSLTDDTSVRLRESKIYYINDGDAKLYEAGGGATIDHSSVVTSNWYADNPHDADQIAVAEANQFSVMIDEKSGPVYDINAATLTASEHCQSLGKSHAKFLSQGYPTNDRSVLKATFQCQ